MEEEKDIKKQLIILGIVVLLICVGLSGCEEQKNQGNIEMFIGTWEITEDTSINSDYINTTWEIHNNGSLKIANVWSYNFSNETSSHTSIIWNLWDIKNGKLFLNRKPGSGKGYNNMSYDYYFSNEGNTLKLNYFGIVHMELNKID